MTKQLLTPSKLHDYQKEAYKFQFLNDYSMLWLQLGLGKTICTLTTIVDRMNHNQVQKTLIFGPLRVIQAVWAREAKKWTHTKHLRFSVMHGTPEKRLRALFADADIYLCNYENMNWLAQQLTHYYISQDKPLPFQFIVYDEVSKMKSSTALRVAGGYRDKVDKHGKDHKIKITGWRKLIPHFKYRTGLTGTPASNGYVDLHGQYLAVDGGERLGEYVTHFKNSYFTSDYQGWTYTPTEIGKHFIEEKISDITIKMDADTYLDMPKCKTIDIMVDLPPKARKAYDEVEKEMFTKLDNGTEIEVFSRSSVSNKTLQFANGFPYFGETKEYEKLHSAKLDALEDILEEAAGQPVLCSYTYKSDAEQIMKRFKKYRPVNLTKTKSKDTEKIINKWNQGKIKLLVGHPACLHPDTLVLTDRRGWTKLIEVMASEKVFDGVEFVSHSGCSYSGYKEVTNLFEVTMTPGHKLLIDNEWVRAADVRNCGDTKRKALYEYEGDDQYLSEMFTLRNRIKDIEKECDGTQSTEKEVLPTLHNSNVNVPGFGGAPCRLMSVNRTEQNGIAHEVEPWNDSRPSGAGCNELTLREEYNTKERSEEECKKEHVYDLVDCGPRHRFVIRNDKGEVFISHNSMGHGVDGLQDSGSILVWFGLNWSLELYEQMCGRLNRQGQTKSVSIIRILCKDTVDLAVADALTRKTDDQEGLKSALQRYRDGITTNALGVNFF